MMRSDIDRYVALEIWKLVDRARRLMTKKLVGGVRFIDANPGITYQEFIDSVVNGNGAGILPYCSDMDIFLDSIVEKAEVEALGDINCLTDYFALFCDDIYTDLAEVVSRKIGRYIDPTEVSIQRWLGMYDVLVKINNHGY